MLTELFAIETAMQVLPCGVIGVLLRMQSMSFLEGAILPIVGPLSKKSIRVVYRNQLGACVAYPSEHVKFLSAS
jgi:hypothetical protein